jgi:hypothetical protein
MNFAEFNREAEKLSQDLKKCNCPTFEILWDEDTYGRWLICRKHDYKYYQSASELAQLGYTNLPNIIVPMKRPSYDF